MRRLHPSLNTPGFTIIELTFVMVFIGIIATMSVPTFKAFNQRQSLKLKFDDMATNIKMQQGRSLDGVKANNNLAVWGVRFKEGEHKYTLFSCPAEVNAITDYKYTCTGVVSSEVGLDDKIIIDTISYHGTDNIADVIFTNYSSGQILFQDKDGADLKDLNGNPITDLNITLTQEDLDESKVLRIARTGGISEEAP